MAFLREGFETKSTDRYMKFVAGENRFRVLSEAIDGYLYWLNAEGQLVPRDEIGGKGSKPVRVRTLEEASKKTEGSQYDCKQFIAFVVWNYTSKAMEILEITQKGIMRSLEGLSRSEDWGDPTAYDIIIDKSGEKMATEYMVRPIPPKEFAGDVTGLSKINLEALYEGGDPFLDTGVAENVSNKDFEEIKDEVPFKE